MAATRENPLQPSAFIKVKFLGPDNKLWPVKGLLDSGNLTNAAAAMSLTLARRLKLNIYPTRTKVGTAAQGGTLEVVGEVKQLKMALTARLVVSLHRVLIIKDLNSPLNLSLNFLKSVKASINFSQRTITIEGFNIPIIAGLYDRASRLRRETEVAQEEDGSTGSDGRSKKRDGSMDTPMEQKMEKQNDEDGQKGIGPLLAPSASTTAVFKEFETFNEMLNQVDLATDITRTNLVKETLRNLNIQCTHLENFNQTKSHFLKCNKIAVRLGGNRTHRVMVRGEPRKWVHIGALSPMKASNARAKVVVSRNHVLAANSVSLVNCQIKGTNRRNMSVFIKGMAITGEDEEGSGPQVVEGVYHCDQNGRVKLMVGNMTDNHGGLPMDQKFSCEILKKTSLKVSKRQLERGVIQEAVTTAEGSEVTEDDIDIKKEDTLEFKKLWKTLKLEDNKMLQENPDIAKKVKQIIYEYRDIFSYSAPGETDLVELDLKLKPGTQPIRQKVRPLNPKLEEDLQKQVDSWLTDGVITPSDSPWSSPLVPVKKKDGTVRWAVDYRKVNRCLEQDSYPLPRIDHLLERAGGNKVYSTLDATAAYFNIRVNEKSRKVTAFATPNGLYEFCRMPFGVSTAPSVYSRFIAAALNRLGTHGVNVYLDDVLIYSQSLKDHLIKMKEVFQAHRDAGIKLKPSKTVLFRERVEYLGHMLDANGISMVESYMDRIRDWPTPTSIKELNTMLGFFGYYRTFIKSFAELTASMNEQKKRLKLEWTEEMERNFKTLKEEFVKGPVRAAPQFNTDSPFQLTTDFSSVAIAAVLSQVQDGTEKVIACAGRKTTSAEKKYPSWKGECSAIIYGIRKWAHILSFKRFQINTDSKALTHLSSLKAGTGMIARWTEELQSYDFTVVHRPGRENVNADCLSRRTGMPEPTVEEEQEQNEYVGTVEADETVDYSAELQREEILKKQAEDDILRAVRGWVCQGHLPEKKDLRGLHQDAQQYAQLFESLKLQPDGVLAQELDTAFGLKTRILVPDSLKDAIFKMSHGHQTAGHFGVTATVARVRRNFYYPGMNQDIRTRVGTCLPCLAKITKEKLRAGVHVPAKNGFPMQSIYVDLVGPLSVTARENQFILSVQDGYSRFISLYPLKSKAAQGVVDTLCNEFFSVFGCPGRLHSDNGTEFVNSLMTGMKKRLGIVHTRGPTYNPQSNQVERFHKTLSSMLRVMLPREDTEWDQHLPAITLAYNTKVCDATGVTPSLAFLGREAKLPIDLIIQTPDIGFETQDHGVRHLMSRYTKIYNFFVKKNDATIRRNAKTYLGTTHFEVGQEVWYLTARKVPGKSQKITNSWTGPWLIEERVTEVLYRIRPKDTNSPHKPMTANVSRLKRVLNTATNSRIPHNVTFDEEDEDGEELHSGQFRPPLEVPIYTPSHYPMMRDMGGTEGQDRAEESMSAPEQPPQIVQDAVIPPEPPIQDPVTLPEEDTTMPEAPTPEVSGKDNIKRGTKRDAVTSGADAETRSKREMDSPLRKKNRQASQNVRRGWKDFTKEVAGYEAAAKGDTSSEDEMNLNELCIPVKHGAKPPYRATAGAAGYDFYLPVTVELAPGTVSCVELGLALALPPCTYLQLHSRSSLAKKGITVLGGVVDSDYRGNISVLLLNTNSTPFVITRGQRVCQGVLLKYETATFHPVDQLPTTDRGSGAFGHTN